ncbi:hypothetical protein M885DRAFT_155120 [Pelagophyceae sp. CCMP2097]|nr:hypothetical protein M885DRAFT_155120 [Pelagophyceae sp. CCMP2097]
MMLRAARAARRAVTPGRRGASDAPARRGAPDALRGRAPPDAVTFTTPVAGPATPRGPAAGAAVTAPAPGEHGRADHGAQTDGAQTDGAQTDGAQTDGAQTPPPPPPAHLRRGGAWQALCADLAASTTVGDVQRALGGASDARRGLRAIGNARRRRLAVGEDGGALHLKALRAHAGALVAGWIRVFLPCLEGLLRTGRGNDDRTACLRFRAMAEDGFDFKKLWRHRALNMWRHRALNNDILRAFQAADLGEQVFTASELQLLRCRALNAEILEAWTAADVLLLFERHGADFNAVNLMTCISRIAKMAQTPRKGQAHFAEDLRLEKLAKTLTVSVDARSLRGDHLAALCWSLSKIDAPAARVALDTVGRRLRSGDLAKLHPRELSAVLWWSTSGANTTGAPPELLAAAYEAVAPHFGNVSQPDSQPDFDPRRLLEFQGPELSTFLRACAAAPQPDAALFRLCADDVVAAPRYLARLGARDVSSIVWAFSKADVSAPLLFEKLAKRCIAQMEFFRPRDYAEVSWAYARASGGDDASTDLFAAMALKAPVKLEAFTARDLATVAWAFSKAAIQAPALFQALALEALNKLHLFKAPDGVSRCPRRCVARSRLRH